MESNKKEVPVIPLVLHQANELYPLLVPFLLQPCIRISLVEYLLLTKWKGYVLPASSLAQQERRQNPEITQQFVFGTQASVHSKLNDLSPTGLSLASFALTCVHGIR